MDIVTRQATAQDAAAIARAHTRAWQVAYEGIVPADFLAGIDVGQRTDQWHQNLTQPALADGTPSPLNLVAEIQGEVVGFACVGVWREAPERTIGAEVWAMYVHPDHWGTGAGYALMNASMEHLRELGATTGYLWVLEDNTLARSFYERQGWHADDVTKDDTIGGAAIIERRYSIVVR